jgi:Tfp pilus assembly protein PilX
MFSFCSYAWESPISQERPSFWEVTMLILLLPITTFCVAVLGFYVWHRQLTRKRRFEVADAAMSAFSRAEAALAQARNSAYFGLKAECLAQHNDAFDELERAAFAAEVHFGEEIANEIRGRFARTTASFWQRHCLALYPTDCAQG